MNRSLETHWRLKSFFKNICKGKFKAMFRYFYDSEYRRNIDYMLTLVRSQSVEAYRSTIPLSQIIPGHQINYPSWVLKLRRKIREQGTTSIEPIKVIFDPRSQKFLIVDGNHRYAALRRELSIYHVIPVELLCRVSMDSKDGGCLEGI